MYLEADTIKLGALDVSELAEKVATLSEEEWMRDEARQKKFAVHKHTQTIWLIFDRDYRHRGPTHRDMMDVFGDLTTPALDLIKDFYKEILKEKIRPEHHGPDYFVRIIMTRLAPGGEIRPHRDGGYSLLRCHRIHLPIITNDKCVFRVGDTSMHMPAGELWEINNRLEHGVKNDGDEARIHMIFDYVQPGEIVDDPKGQVVA